LREFDSYNWVMFIVRNLFQRISIKSEYQDPNTFSLNILTHIIIYAPFQRRKELNIVILVWKTEASTLFPHDVNIRVIIVERVPLRPFRVLYKASVL